MSGLAGLLEQYTCLLCDQDTCDQIWWPWVRRDGEDEVLLRPVILELGDLLVWHLTLVKSPLEENPFAPTF